VLFRSLAVHLFADHLLDPPHHPPAEWQIRVNAGGKLLDQARPEQELVVIGFGLGGGLAQSTAKHPRHAL
jgi:hypothetical protein